MLIILKCFALFTLYLSPALIASVILVLAMERAMLHRRRRKASAEFRDAYGAWKRAEADPYCDATAPLRQAEKAARHLAMLKA